MPCRRQFQSEKSILLWQPDDHEKPQLSQRLPAPFIRHLLAQHRAEPHVATAAAGEIGVSRARFFELYRDYLAACAQGAGQTWSPGRSGGNHHPKCSNEVTSLLTKLLSSQPPSSYSAAASELQQSVKVCT